MAAKPKSAARKRAAAPTAAAPAAVDKGRRPPIGSPSGVAAIGGMILGALLTAFGVTLAFDTGLQAVSLWLGICILAPLLVAVARLMQRGRRVGWAFFIGLTGPLALATLFGAPKIRDAVTARVGDGAAGSLWVLALLPCLAFATLCALASIDHARYEDTTEL